MWVPGNGLHRGVRVGDSEEAAVKYLDGLVGDGGGEEGREDGVRGRDRERERRRAYVAHARLVVRDLEGFGVKFVPTLGMPDYHYGEVEGGVPQGRSIEPALFDRKVLPRSWRDVLRGPSIFAGPPMYIWEGIRAARVMTLGGVGMLLRIVSRWVGWKALGRQPVGMGRAWSRSCCGRMCGKGRRFGGPRL